MQIGSNIARLRQDIGITQEEMAGALYVSRDLVSKWENGVRRPDNPTIRQIAEFFGVEPMDIFDPDECLREEMNQCVPEGADITRQQLTSMLNGFLADLPPRDRRLFLQRYYHVRSFAEIASDLQMRENHVRSRLSKLRKKLVRYIRGNAQ